MTPLVFPDVFVTPTTIDLDRLFSTDIVASTKADPNTIFFLAPATREEVLSGDHVYGYSAKRSAVVRNVKG